MNINKVTPRTLKGFRDFLPSDTRKRDYVKKILSKVFESYGFEPIETPAIEYEDILLGKYGEEGDRLMYRFEDKGLRKVALRYDQTVPLARVVAEHQNDLPYPFKRAQIQNVWRADNTQRGRFREFLQCDIDTVGTDSKSADAEILAVIEASFIALGFNNFKIIVNDRKVFDGIDPKAILIIDKLKKIGEEEVKKELKEKGFDEGILERVKSMDKTQNLKTILEILEEMGVSNEKIEFDPTLARGLDYYTGIIIEVELEGFSAGSVGGGGRYDNLIGMFGSQQVPAVGFAFGFDRVIEAMTDKKLFPKSLRTTKVLVTIPSLELARLSWKIGSQLRLSEINVEVYLDENINMEKQFKFADKKNIPYIIIPIDEMMVELRKKSDLGEIQKRTVTIDSLPNEIK